jgi:hypothetical protein
LTMPHPIKPTSTPCHSAWQPNPGRRSTYRRGDSVQTTGTTSADKTSIPKAEALRMMREGTNITPQEAKKLKLIDDVTDSSYPRDAARSWQI